VKKQKRSAAARREENWGWIMVAPTIIGLLVLNIWPFLQTIYTSFCEHQGFGHYKFIGLGNFIRAFQDSEFLHAFWFTALFTLVTVALINVLAFAVASILTQEIPGTNIFRTVFFMPNLIGGIVLGYIWQLIFNGVLARYDLALKISAKYGFWGLVILVCWQQIGYMMIIYIAGLQAIPGDLNEAAAIDGANGWQRLWNVTIPNMMPSITICTFLTLTNGFKLFDQNLSLTAGEPMKQTEMLALNIFNTFYGRVGWQGVGQAKAVLFFILVVGLGILQLKMTRSKEVQQ